MSGESSCRPDRLHHLDLIVQAMADGLCTRCGTLQDAIEAYRAGCETAYAVDCGGTIAALRHGRGQLRVLATWTRGVGHAFDQADIRDKYITMQSTSSVLTLPDRTVLGSLHAFHDPYLGVSATQSAVSPGHPGDDDDQSGPPAWLSLAGFEDPAAGGSTAATIARAAASAGTTEASVVSKLGRGLGKLATPLLFASAAKQQWDRDRGLSDLDRVRRALIKATATALGGAAGETGGGAVGALSLDPAFEAAAVVGGGLGGGAAGSALADKLPGMQPGPHDARNPDKERNDAEEEGEGHEGDFDQDDPDFDSTARTFVHPKDPTHPVPAPDEHHPTPGTTTITTKPTR